MRFSPFLMKPVSLRINCVIASLIVGMLFCLMHSADAQITQPAHFEVVHERGDNPFEFISMKDNGLCMVRQKQRSQGTQNDWEVILLDSALKQFWKLDLLVDERFHLSGYDYVSGELDLLFHNGEAAKGEMKLTRIYLGQHTTEEHTISPKLDFRVTHFIVCGSNAVFGGYVEKQSTLLLYDLTTAHLKILPGLFVPNTELLEVKANLNKTFNVVLIERGTRDKKLLMLKTFDESGLLLMEDDIETDPGKTILAATTSALANEELFLAGTWAPGTSKQSAGFFTVLADPFSQQPIHYFDFGEVPHFFDFMTPKKAARKRENATKRRELQKIPSFRSDIHLIRLDETARGFVFFTELYSSNAGTGSSSNPFSTTSGYPAPYSPYGYYYPSVNRFYNYPNYPYGYNNFPSSRNLEVSMIHSSLILFDQHGRLLEDFGLPLNDKKISSLEQVSDYYASENFIQVAKGEKEFVVSTNLIGGAGSEIDTLKIIMGYPEDVVQSDDESIGGIRYWYGPFAYMWGHATVKNRKEPTGDLVRSIYYVNKVKVE